MDHTLAEMRRLQGWGAGRLSPKELSAIYDSIFSVTGLSLMGVWGLRWDHRPKNIPTLGSFLPYHYCLSFDLIGIIQWRCSKSVVNVSILWWCSSIKHYEATRSTLIYGRSEGRKERGTENEGERKQKEAGEGDRPHLSWLLCPSHYLLCSAPLATRGYDFPAMTKCDIDHTASLVPTSRSPALPSPGTASLHSDLELVKDC